MLNTRLRATIIGFVIALGSKRNSPRNKSERAEELVKAQGAWHLFLPPYSPDLNPIEMPFSKLKTLLRKRAARSFDANVAEMKPVTDDVKRWKLMGIGALGVTGIAAMALGVSFAEVIRRIVFVIIGKG
ncbi:hypothetical protein ABIA18_002490 [Sinorhizobium fredii]